MHKERQQKKREIPNSIGVILDGNRRWARSHGLSSYEGHRVGFEKLKELVSWIKEAEIKNLIIYALSTENLKRAPGEVAYLLDLFKTTIKNQLEEITKEDARVMFAGDIKRFPEDLQKMMLKIEKETAGHKSLNLVIGAAYGGRAEIVHAVNCLLKENKKSITEKDFGNYLWTAGIPDPDLIIRTGGEKRLSNFLLWQAAYSELFFTDTLWPDFSKEKFDAILKEYIARERRYGK